jgi:hypothetical protein
MTDNSINGSIASGREAKNPLTGSGASFVPPSIRMVTGESVMPGDTPAMPLVPSATQAPETATNPYYLSGYLKNYLGKNMMVQFLIGENSLVDKTGRLIDVGANFIVLQPVGSDDMLMGDLYAIKFVTIYR